VRAWLGRRPGVAEPGLGVEHDAVVLLECNLDNTTGETLGYAMERLYRRGARRVVHTDPDEKEPAGEQAVGVVQPDLSADLAHLLLRETTT